MVIGKYSNMKYTDNLIKLIKMVYPENIKLQNLAILGDDRLPDFLFTQRTVSVNVTEAFSPEAYEKLKERVIEQRRKHAIYILALDERAAYRRKYLIHKQNDDMPF